VVNFVFEFVLELVWKWKFVWGWFDEFVLVIVGWLNQSF